MKKLTTFLLAVFMVFSLAACAGDNAGTESGTSKTQNSVNNTNTNQDKNQSGTISDNSESLNSSEDSNNSDNSEDSSSPNNSENSQKEDNSASSEDSSSDTVKVLVAYFSATNTTKGVAENIADSLNADLYEITPEDPYTDADLDYHDDKSRSTIEMNDSGSRPAISGSVENMEQYDIIFLGYPIWWGEAPRILSTFVESYNFSGKTVVPFCTSGGSGVGSSAANLERLTDGAEWLSGTRLNGSASRSSVVEWINDLGLDITAQ